MENYLLVTKEGRIPKEGTLENMKSWQKIYQKEYGMECMIVKNDQKFHEKVRKWVRR